jgi:hypothetical protein
MHEAACCCAPQRWGCRALTKPAVCGVRCVLPHQRWIGEEVQLTEGFDREAELAWDGMLGLAPPHAKHRPFERRWEERQLTHHGAGGGTAGGLVRSAARCRRRPPARPPAQHSVGGARIG